uniref:Transmembrane protein n=1 Tax=Panagrellus redivivus TaxID=6233 RepID=A0A7E4VFE5_PANRE
MFLTFLGAALGLISPVTCEDGMFNYYAARIKLIVFCLLISVSVAFLILFLFVLAVGLYKFCKAQENVEQNVPAVVPDVPVEAQPEDVEGAVEVENEDEVEVESEEEVDVDIDVDAAYKAALIEDALRNLNRNKMLRFKGFDPVNFGDRLPSMAFLLRIFSTNHPRKIADFELAVFLESVANAFQEANSLMSLARWQLCRHGATCDDHQNWTFTKQTYRYIRRLSTPGFIAWYAFAVKHGHEVHFKKNDLKDKSALNKLSVPALLTVFFREELPEYIRRRAFYRLRCQMPRIAAMHMDDDLIEMPYPLCLTPAMKETNDQQSRYPLWGDIIVPIAHMNWNKYNTHYTLMFANLPC